MYKIVVFFYVQSRGMDNFFWAPISRAKKDFPCFKDGFVLAIYLSDGERFYGNLL